MKFVKILLFLLFASVVSLSAQYDISYKLLKSYDRVFYNTNNPVMDLKVYNNDNYEKCADEISCRVLKDSGEPVYFFNQSFTIAPGDSAQLSFSFQVPVGFYKVILEKEDSVITQACMGYEPEQIKSLPDSNFSFSDYWEGILLEMRATPMTPQLTKMKIKGGKLRNIYSVKVNSIGGGCVEGYLAVPKGKGVYPVVITCTDKNELLFMPDPNSREEFIDFVISPRKGEMFKEYYYRTLCIDVVRAIDYVVTRLDVDLKNIFLQGCGRGGAFVLAASALDRRVTAVAVYAPGLMNESVTDELKPYDIKNLSGRIEAPVIMGVGLEDEKCRPRENFSIYNLINSNKQYYIFVEGHTPPALWGDLAHNFFMKYLR